MPVTAAQYARRVNGYNEVFDVVVGAERQRFTLYKTLAIRESGFLKAATSPSWNDGRAVDLTDEEPQNFAVFLRWLETHRIKVYNPDYYKPPPSKGNSAKDIKSLIAAYGLGQKLVAFRFCDAIIDVVERLLMNDGARLTVDHIEEAYMHNSPLRKLVVDYFVDRMDTANKERLDATYHPEFLAELAQALWNTDDYTPATVGCRYHQHTAREPCSALRPISSSSPTPLNYDFVKERTTLRLIMGQHKAVIHAYNKNALDRDRIGSLILHFDFDLSKKDGIIEIHLPTFSPITFELFIHWILLDWSPLDVLPHIVVSVDEPVAEDTLIALVDFYRLGKKLGDTVMCNHAIDAIVGWTNLTQKMPSEQVIDHAFTNLGPIYRPDAAENGDGPRLNKCLLLLVGIHAWNDALPTSTNIQFLQALTIFQSSIRIKLLDFIASSECSLMRPEAPYSGKNLCKYFHEPLTEWFRICPCNIDVVDHLDQMSRHPTEPLPQETTQPQKANILELCQQRFKAAANAPRS